MTNTLVTGLCLGWSAVAVAAAVAVVVVAAAAAVVAEIVQADSCFEVIKRSLTLRKSKLDRLTLASIFNLF